MALPQDGQDANGLTKVTQIPAGKELMFIDPTTNEGGIITLEDLTKQILNGLTTQAFKMDTGTQTIPAAINYLFGNPALSTQLLNCTMKFQYYNDRALFYFTDSKSQNTIRIDFDTNTKSITVQKNNENIGTTFLS